jgi:putative ABC transport system substrate-binding protein
MASRRQVVVSLGAVVLAAPLMSLAQQQPAKIARIGYLQPVVPENNSSPLLEDFRQGLRELGYVEGRNLQLEVRWGEGKLERMPALAEELVRLKVDVIVAVTAPSVMAAKQATGTIPIVMPFSSDPVGDGLVTSLARPGGNITGLSMMAPELGAKRLQLLKEVFPKIFRPVAVVWNPDYVGMMARFRETQGAAPVVGMGVRSVEVRDSRELERALESMERERPDAIVLLADPLTVSQRLRIVEYAAAERVPAIYEISQFVDAGGLMSYGPNVDELVRRAAIYVDKILKGAKPADLPIEQPTKFEFVINLKCAKALGVTIPQTVLLQADRVIE